MWRLRFRGAYLVDIEFPDRGRGLTYLIVFLRCTFNFIGTITSSVDCNYLVLILISIIKGHLLRISLSYWLSMMHIIPCVCNC